MTTMTTTTRWRSSMSAKSERWVIKIGSALLTNNGAGLDASLMQSWVDQMQALRAAGRELIVVPSGAVAEGMTRLGWKTRSDSLHALQAAAAVGQMALIHAWEARFETQIGRASCRESGCQYR